MSLHSAAPTGCWLRSAPLAVATATPRSRALPPARIRDLGATAHFPAGPLAGVDERPEQALARLAREPFGVPLHAELEAPIRGFWTYYAELMNIQPGADPT